MASSLSTRTATSFEGWHWIAIGGEGTSGTLRSVFNPHLPMMSSDVLVFAIVDGVKPTGMGAADLLGRRSRRSVVSASDRSDVLQLVVNEATAAFNGDMVVLATQRLPRTYARRRSHRRVPDAVDVLI